MVESWFSDVACRDERVDKVWLMNRGESSRVAAASLAIERHHLGIFWGLGVKISEGWWQRRRGRE